MTLHSEINKQDSQLRIYTYKSKLFSTFVLAKKKKNDIEDICKNFTHLALEGPQELGIHTFLQLWSHNAGFESQICFLVGV